MIQSLVRSGRVDDLVATYGRRAGGRHCQFWTCPNRLAGPLGRNGLTPTAVGHAGNSPGLSHDTALLQLCGVRAVSGWRGRARAPAVVGR